MVIAVAESPTSYTAASKKHDSNGIHSSPLTLEQEAICDIHRLIKQWQLQPLVTDTVHITLDESVISKPAIVALAPIDASVSFLSTGAEIAPGQVMAAIEPSWIEKRSINHNGTTKALLFLRKALLFECDKTVTSKSGLRQDVRPILRKFTGQGYPIGYFIQLYTLQGWYEYPHLFDVIKHAESLETNVVCPMSSSLFLGTLVNDKLFTRAVLQRENVPIPDFLAISKSLRQPKISTLSTLVSSGILKIYSPQSDATDSKPKQWIETVVDQFTSRFPSYDEVVVKPSGSRFCSGDHVAFFKVREEKAKLIEFVYDLLMNVLRDDESILIDGKIRTPYVKIRHDRFLGPKRQLESKRCDWVLRVLCCRQETGPGESGVCSGVLARIGKDGKPVNGSNLGGFWTKLQDACEAANLDYNIIKTQVYALADQFFKAWNAFETSLHTDCQTSQNVRTDFVGLDVMLQVVSGDIETGSNLVVKPSIIEVNDHDAAGFDQIDVLHPEVLGAGAAPYVKNALYRTKSFVPELRQLCALPMEIKSEAKDSNMDWICPGVWKKKDNDYFGDYKDKEGSKSLVEEMNCWRI
ncbi:hypothetical protein BKA69DRAFT_67988 [Paraphysoderma sedebokerense]|nr:hypothetical protein BKA69DRAFT_67988 [Paraphysoderma sedebokerense]